jgi:hypothetical protein
VSRTKNLGEWLTSRQAKKELRIDSCELMHLRLEGTIRFQKKANAFMYAREDVRKVRRKMREGLRHGDPRIET